MGTTVTEHWLQSEGLRQRVWLVAPAGGDPLPALVWNHGSQMGLAPNGSLLDRSAEPQVQGGGAPWRAWADALGIALVIPETHGYAGSEGEPPIESMSDPMRLMAFLDARARDAAAATLWAAERPEIQAGRLVAAGASHGGVVSLLASAQHAYAGTALLAMAPWYRRADVGLPQLRAAAAAGWGPLLVQHLLTDTLAPPSVSREIHAAAAAGRRSELREYPGVPGVEGHAVFLASNRAQWTGDFSAFLGSCFGPP